MTRERLNSSCGNRQFRKIATRASVLFDQSAPRAVGLTQCDPSVLVLVVCAETSLISSVGLRTGLYLSSRPQLSRDPRLFFDVYA